MTIHLEKVRTAPVLRTKVDITRFLQAHVRPATGCTEPGAVAYAVAIAVHTALGNLPRRQEDGAVVFNDGADPVPLLLDKLKGIEISVDRDTMKNAAAVFIPGTKFQQGILIAAALGAFCHPKGNLNLLEGVTQQTLSYAGRIAPKIVLKEITDKTPVPTLDVRVTVKFVDREISVRLHYDHAFIEAISDGGIEVYSDQFVKPGRADHALPETMTDVFQSVSRITDSDKVELLNGLFRNLRIAFEGLINSYGLTIGREYLRQEFPERYDEVAAAPEKIFFLPDMDVFRLTRILTAAAVDARMGGAQFPVTSTSGSGNQGIAATVPLIAVSSALNLIDLEGNYTSAGLKLRTLLNKPADYVITLEQLSRAALFSHLIAAIATSKIGVIGAWCGCATKAGLASAAAVVYLLGGGEDQVHQAINLMAANATGVICDGAKPGCALKLGADTPVQYALMALRGGRIPPYNGIVDPDALTTIDNIGRLSGTTHTTDQTMVTILKEKYDDQRERVSDQDKIIGFSTETGRSVLASDLRRLFKRE